MMLSGLRWQKCESCPTKFLVLAESVRRECIRCEQKRKRRKHMAKESRRWHRDKRDQRHAAGRDRASRVREKE